MKFPKASTATTVVLYAGSLASIGAGVWMMGGADWRGAALLVVGGLVWLDLWAAARARVPKAKGKA